LDRKAAVAPAQGATVKKVITIVDRLEEAEENLKKEGLALAPIFTTKDLLAQDGCG
jgi:orotate phosphoribosyltransferase